MTQSYDFDFKILIQPGSNLMVKLTGIIGNVTYDKIKPSIWVAQNTEIKRILTKPLYDKILEDFINASLDGVYKQIYEDYIAFMLVFYSTADFVQRNSIMIANGGNFKHSPDNAQIVDFKEVDRNANYYRDLGRFYEDQFKEFVKKNNVPEYDSSSNNNDNDFFFGVYML
ncbi:hypothetical protein ABGT15_04230 [Flavobacterium enshiense]|uniref:DUF6712 family protein n=1 Tax=Flavobacterium enshiense TaxID=1341165 RepID=UPI00345D81F6